MRITGDQAAGSVLVASRTDWPSIHPTAVDAVERILRALWGFVLLSFLVRKATRALRATGSQAFRRLLRMTSDQAAGSVLVASRTDWPSIHPTADGAVQRILIGRSLWGWFLPTFLECKATRALQATGSQAFRRLLRMTSDQAAGSVLVALRTDWPSIHPTADGAVERILIGRSLWGLFLPTFLECKATRALQATGSQAFRRFWGWPLRHRWDRGYRCLRVKKTAENGLIQGEK